MMGDSATFAGASDNASGVAMLLSLASYFGKFPQHYSILFVAFAGENAGLMGSEFFTWQPPVPLKNIKFLTNLGIMSDFTTGMTVVNGTQYPIEFDLMDKINKKEEFVSEITPKGQAANSDHYHFSKLGVPAFFIYSNGGKAHFHDVFDSPELLSLTNTGGANRLLIDFIKSLN
jgi:Zn-dependent M28 family amino/carboxypeptidase